MTRLTTIAVRNGLERDDQHGAVIPPLHLSSNFTFEGLGRPRQFDYTRSGNPTRALLAETLASLEGGANGTVTASGMAAITTVLQLLGPGDRLIAPHDCYGGTWRLLDAWQRRGGFAVDWVDLTDPVQRRSALAQPARMVWVETPSNPLLRISDIAAVRAEAPDAIVVVDNTFLSPLLQRPLDLGADIVVHSTTKYINGHSDVVGGAVIARDPALGEELGWWANCLGLTGAPFDAWLTLRGVRTLHARMTQHIRNAAEVVDLLSAHPSVERVHYPGLPTHPGHAVAQRQQSGFGAMVSFELSTTAGEHVVERFVERLAHFSLAESLGGVESLIAHPATMTHAAMSAEARERAGISDALLRLSVGIEDPRDLCTDLAQALDAATAGTVSCVVDQGNLPVTVEPEHSGSHFTSQRLSIFMLGAGTVGGALLRELDRQRAALLEVHDLEPVLVGVKTRDRVAFDPAGLAPGTWRAQARPAQHVDLDMLDTLARSPVPVLVDCTAAEGMESLYEAALTRGIHVVVANKKALTTPTDTRDHLLETARRSHRAFRYETTVGAALPIVSTLHDLVRTGDEVRRIEGALSGSLGFICEQLNRGVPIDCAVQEAMDLGYTEPRPQEDLAGTDAARKALILAREMGLRLDLSDVEITPLVPEALLAIDDPAEFIAALGQHRDSLTASTDALRGTGQSLRYLAVIDPADRPALRVGPVAVGPDHPAAVLAGSQAFVAFSTRRYGAHPLIVQGAGAGAEVTASGVLAEVLRIARGLTGSDPRTPGSSGGILRVNPIPEATRLRAG